MDISKQIIDQRIQGIIKENPDFFIENEEKNISKAFCYWVWLLIWI